MIRWLVLAWLAAIVGCSGPTAPPTPDAAPGACTSAADCDDGRFCNGTERCAPGTAGADVRGCAPPSSTACPGACDESADRCITDDCADPDADDDGEPRRGCGGDDCDDADGARAPGNVEVCDPDGVDEDCDPTTFGARDGDTDGYVDGECCNGTGTAEERCGDDCDDARTDVHPDLGELCDFEDNDCDGSTDEGSRISCYTDADSDRYAPIDAMEVMACECPVRTTVMEPGELTTDCDDARPASSPEGSETCNAHDDDCDGTVDERVCVSCWTDADRDGYALATAVEMRLASCADGLTATSPAMAADCNDASAAQSPMGNEACTANGIDDDCDGTVDDLTGDDWYRDCDSDGYGVGAPVIACSQPGTPTMPSCASGGGTHARVSGDCDDTRMAVRPGAPAVPDLCDTLDNDCNPATADGAGETWLGAPCDGADGDACREGALTCGAGGVDMICDDPDGETDREICGSGDEDCDGAIDEATAANADCASRIPPHVTSTTCAAGACVSGPCETGWNDCSAAAGCESACVWRGCHAGGCDDAIAVAVIGNRSCAVRESGAVACWGAGVLTPVIAGGVSDAVDAEGGYVRTATGRVFQLRPGSGFPFVEMGWIGGEARELGADADTTEFTINDALCVVRTDGTVICSRYGTFGARGDGMNVDSRGVGAVTGLTDAVEVAIGEWFGFGCARRAGGTVVCWGSNALGQLGDGLAAHGSCPSSGYMPLDCALSPVAVAGISGAAEIVAGHGHACARLTTGEVRCWGRGAGTTGRGAASCSTTTIGGTTYTERCSRTPVPVPGLVAARIFGGYVPMALTASGQLFYVEYDNSLTPAGTIVGVTDGEVRHGGGGGTHGGCIVASGAVSCMGPNGAGEVGDGTTIRRSTFVPVSSPP